ncbi:MAG: tRNA lysidine(34) synthetase TilS [Oscillospiraceae bacterium]|nr:tRNA lysidine(34) synthetase TilS [Oscillospiraceae bacterium]
MKVNVLKTITEFNMLSQGDLVVVGLSGGADSVALLSLLCTLRNQLDLRLVACHINHNLRGQESLRDEQFVRALCQRLDVECRICSEDVAAAAKSQNRSVEEVARDIRYRFFAETAGERGKIATAHTAADNTETVLMNLARGSGLRGLCGIPPVRGNVIRPLIGCTRSQTEQWCRQNGLEWVEDSTNAEDDYTRNRIRHHVVPVLRQQNQSVDQTVAQMSERLRRDADFLQELAQNEAQRITDRQGRLDRKSFLALARPLQDRILLSMISGQTQPSARMTDLCLELARQGSGSTELTKGICFKADENSLWVEECPTVAYLQEEAELPRLTVGREYMVYLGQRRLTTKLTERQANSENVYKLPINNLLCYDKIQDVLVLRTRRTGDRITLGRRGVSKSLKKLFCEEKILPQERELRLVLAEKNGKVIWVEGIGPAAGYLPDDKSKTLLELKIFGGENPGEDK